MSKQLDEHMKTWQTDFKPLTLDAPLAEFGLRSEKYPDAKTLGELIVLMQAEDQTQDDKEKDESTVPLESQLGRDVAQYVARYFPGSTIADIQSTYHRGYFIGDYSIKLDVKLEHPIFKQVSILFTNEDVPSRPQNWQELLALPDIRLFLTSITLRDVRYGEDTSATYALPGMYQEEIKAWCKSHGDSVMLCGHTETSDLFIISTERVDDEKLDHLLSQADYMRQEVETQEAASDEAPTSNILPFLPQHPF